MRSGKVILGTLAGLAIGAIAGILFAPEKGSKTRKLILDKSNEYADELKSKFDEFCDSLADKFETAKQEAEETASKGKDKFDDVKKEVKNVASDIKNVTS